MARLISTMRGAALALALLVAQAAAQCPGLNNQFATTMGAGYENQLIANGLRSPRGMVFDKEDNLLVIEQGGGGLRQIKLNADGCVASSKTIISDSSLNHGVDISADGKTVFVSSLESVFAYDYDAAAGTATGKKVIISNMRNGGHSTRTLLRSRTDPDILLVSRGSNANIDSATTDPASGRSLIRMYSIAEITKTAVDMATGGKLLGYGLRNSVAVGENPVTGEVYSAENSIDNAMRFGKDVHNTQPAEEMNYHGRINDTSNPLLGANYGYPTCVAAYEPVDQLGNPELQVGSHFAPNTAAGDGVDAVCEGMQEPRLVFPAHNAPLDLKFDPTGKAAYIAFHGSWNRSPPDGYRLMKVEFGEDGQPVQPANSTNAAVSVMANTNLAVCPGQCFRPTGLAFDSKGRLFMSSDSSGQIFLIKGT